MTVLIGEFRRGIQDIKAYMAGYFSDFVMTAMIFLVCFMSNTHAPVSFSINFIYWFLMSGIIGQGAILVSQEKITGTINQLLTKPVSYFKILLYRNLFHFLFSLIQVTIILQLTSNLFSILKVFSIELFIAGGFFFIALLGIGYAISSITLLNAKVGNFTSVISFVLLFMSGGVMGSSHLAPWIVAINRYQPLALIIEFNKSFIDKGNLDFFLLIRLGVTSIIYFILGLVIFKRVFTLSKKMGISNKY